MEAVLTASALAVVYLILLTLCFLNISIVSREVSFKTFIYNANLLGFDLLAAQVVVLRPEPDPTVRLGSCRPVFLNVGWVWSAD